MHFERLRQAVNHRERWIPFSAFDPADIGTVNARPVAKILLGDAQRSPNPSNDPTEIDAYSILGGHLDEYHRMLLDSLQTRSIIEP